MHYFAFAIFSLIFTWLMLTARTRRRAVTVAVTGILVSVLVISPPTAEAQVSLLQAIQAVLNVINGTIQSALNAINTVRGAMSNFYHNTIWPVQLINQEKVQITQMIGQFRPPMMAIYNLKLNSATLQNPQSLEGLMRDHRVNNFGSLIQSFGNTYRALPLSTDATQADRDMSDMDDALALDSLKTLKATDNATDLELQAADSIETSASQAAPGSAAFLTGAAVASSVRSQALTQKMLAAELRQEAAQMSHQNALRKRGAAFTNQLRGMIVNLLQHN